MNNFVLQISEAVRAAGGRAMLVGGCVRDSLFGFEPKDFDLEVYHLEPARLRAILKSIAHVNTVGEHFAVYKLAFYTALQSAESSAPAASPSDTPADQQQTTRFEIDVSIPRRESKSGKGHRGFVIEGDPFMTFAEAARRRDFTINAILQDPLTDEIIDPFGGVADIHQRLLRVVAADTFVEDSLRVLRAVQIAARFELQIEPQTLALCRSIELADLPHERIWGEIEKLFLLAKRPSIGLQAAMDTGVLDKLFPAIRSLVDCQSDDGQMVDDSANPSFPQDNAFTRTKLRLDEAAKLANDLSKEKRLTLMLAALCQNLVKASGNNDEAVQTVLDTLGIQTIAGYEAREQILSLVCEQYQSFELYQCRERVTDGEFRRLAQRVDMNLLHLLTRAELRARGFGSTELADWFKEKVQTLNLENGAPAPILMGRHLVEAGIKPGKEMGEILRRVYELQLDGTVTTLDEALAAAKT